MQTPERYIVVHQCQNYDKGPVSNVIVSYHTDLDAGQISSLSMAIHTASRHRGIIYRDEIHAQNIERDYNKSR